MLFNHFNMNRLQLITMDAKNISSVDEYLNLQNSSFVPDLCLLRMLINIWDVRTKNPKTRIKGMWVIDFESMSEAKKYFDQGKCKKLSMNFTLEKFNPDDLESDNFFVLIMTGEYAYKYKVKDAILSKESLEEISQSMGCGNNTLHYFDQQI